MRVQTGDAARLAEARAATGDVDDLFAGVALFVGISMVAAALVAASGFRVVFSQRLKQLALLRVVGAHRGQLMRALVVEGVVAGGVGAVTAVVVVLLARELPGPGSTGYDRDAGLVAVVAVLVFLALLLLGPLVVRPV
ncbi:FtsX-like permease family protein, partial [Actinosynnema sp.]|uniref:FtsX-like permease family protein n=1 Tax=Actinosynnema sp. TaxID=1872144 RepID=UPI003F83DB92